LGIGGASSAASKPVGGNKLQSNHQMGCFKRMEVRGQKVEAKLRQEQP
jgi:hypothetical protein